MARALPDTGELTIFAAPPTREHWARAAERADGSRPALLLLPDEHTGAPPAPATLTLPGPATSWLVFDWLGLSGDWIRQLVQRAANDRAEVVRVVHIDALDGGDWLTVAR